MCDKYEVWLKHCCRISQTGWTKCERIAVVNVWEDSLCCRQNCACRLVRLDPSLPSLSRAARGQGGRGDVADGEGAHSGGGWQCGHIEQFWLLKTFHLLILSKSGGEDADKWEEEEDGSEEHPESKLMLFAHLPTPLIDSAPNQTDVLYNASNSGPLLSYRPRLSPKNGRLPILCSFLA